MEFWEKAFLEKETMWGFEPTKSAIITKEFFEIQRVNKILIPGVGYGRNAKVFLESGFDVTGIEISKTAIEIARKNDLDFKIYHGSVKQMPFDSEQYEGIFSYGLIHLLDENDRKLFLEKCFNQLKVDGYMIFTAITKNSPMYIKGNKIDNNNVTNSAGINLYFYDIDSIKEEFEPYGLVEFIEILEPNDGNKNSEGVSFWYIKCKK